MKNTVVNPERWLLTGVANANRDIHEFPSVVDAPLRPIEQYLSPEFALYKREDLRGLFLRSLRVSTVSNPPRQLSVGSPRRTPLLVDVVDHDVVPSLMRVCAAMRTTEGSGSDRRFN